MNQDQDDDLQTLRRMLPRPAERDFPTGRQHQREEHLMTSWLNMSRRPDRRRGLGVRIALPAGLAAAAAAVTLTVLPAQTAAAYTLEHAKGDLVKLTIINPAGKVNTDQLHKDLDRLGVPNLILLGDPRCSTPPGKPAPGTAPSPAPSHGSTLSGPAAVSAALLAAQGWAVGLENGKTVLYVRPGKIPADAKLMVGFPLTKTDPAHGYAVIESGLIDGHVPPTCLPAAPAGSVVVPAHDPSNG